MERRKETAIKAKIPGGIAKAGMSIHLEAQPAKSKPIMENPGTTSVTIYRAIADETHLNKPKVTRLTGIRRILISGFTKSEDIISPTPARRSV
jgi:hypothetical protein